MRIRRSTTFLLVALLACTACEGADATDDAKGSPPVSTQVPASVTEAFIDLDARRAEAIANRDLGALSGIYAANSPALRRVRASILKLRRDGVRVNEEVIRLDVGVVEETPEQARVREKAILNLRFFDEDGREVTEDGRPQVQTTIWILRFEGGQWLLYDAVVKKSNAA